MSEGDRKRAIVETFNAIGVIAWVNHAGNVKVRGGRMRLSPKGTPDVFVIVPPYGRTLGLEVKDAKGKERPSQLDWAVRARRHGAFVATVRTPKEALAAFYDAGAFKF